MPPIDELDQAVAKVLGLDKRGTDAWWRKLDGDHLYDWQIAAEFLPILHLDYNALMAAVAVLEGQGAFFTRSDNVWSSKGLKHYAPQWYQPGDLASEALALSKCIKAVSDDNS